MSKTTAVAEIKARYPRLTARLISGEIRVTERGISVERAEDKAYYTEDADDALSAASCWLYEDQTCASLGL